MPSRRAVAHGMRVLGVDPEGVRPPAEPASLEALLTAADVVSPHAPLTPATHHLIDVTRMRPGAFLVNTARGGLVDSDALLAVEGGQPRSPVNAP